MIEPEIADMLVVGLGVWVGGGEGGGGGGRGGGG